METKSVEKLKVLHIKGKINGIMFLKKEYDEVNKVWFIESKAFKLRSEHEWEYLAEVTFASALRKILNGLVKKYDNKIEYQISKKFGFKIQDGRELKELKKLINEDHIDEIQQLIIIKNEWDRNVELIWG